MTICVFNTSQSVYAQEVREIKDENIEFIISTLNRNVGTKEQRNSALIKRINTFGIKFVMTEDDEQKFVEAGASDGLLAVIRKKSAELEKTSVGLTYLGNKYLNIGRQFRELEEKFTKLAKSNRLQKNDEEALKNEEEAKKNDTEALKNLDRALSYFKMAVDLEPTNVNAMHNVALTYDYANKYDDAISYYTRVLELDPVAPRYKNRGLAYESKGRSQTNPEEKKLSYDRAIEDYTKALSYEPSNTGVLKLRADVHRLWGQTQEYEEDMKRIADIRAGRNSP